MSRQGRFWHSVDKRIKKSNSAVASVGVVKSLDPFSVSYNGIEISTQNGDTVYVNNLILDEKITFTKAQAITCSDGAITENHTNIINNEIEEWLMSIHDRFIIHVGDFVAVQKLGNNTYIILGKVNKIE